MEQEKLKEILELHRKWLYNEAGGVRANLRSANLRYADLRSADLSSANLRYANLSYANLRSADLSSAITDKRYISVNCIGSRKGKTTYCFDDDIIFCGCFKDNLANFILKVKETYPDKKSQYRIEYDAFIAMIKKLKE